MAGIFSSQPFNPEPVMKKIFLSLAALVLLVTSGAAQAATAPATATSPAKPLSAQNSRMKDCAAKYHAKGIAKSQYRAFMSGCLKNPSAAKNSAPAKKSSPTAPSPTTPSGK
jgi:membrane-bound lytic murein transglycosylase B